MARILEDPNYKSADKKVKEIMAVIPGRSEEEIYIALHDHDFDTQKALTALLDSDGSLGQVKLKSAFENGDYLHHKYPLRTSHTGRVDNYR